MSLRRPNRHQRYSHLFPLRKRHVKTNIATFSEPSSFLKYHTLILPTTIFLFRFVIFDTTLKSTSAIRSRPPASKGFSISWRGTIGPLGSLQKSITPETRRIPKRAKSTPWRPARDSSYHRRLHTVLVSLLPTSYPLFPSSRILFLVDWYVFGVSIAADLEICHGVRYRSDREEFLLELPREWSGFLFVYFE